MKPSEYIRKYKKYRDIHSLENLLSVYRYGVAKEWALSFKDPEAMKEPEVIAMKKEIEGEIALAERTIANWKKGLDAKKKQAFKRQMKPIAYSGGSRKVWDTKLKDFKLSSMTHL